MDVVPLGASLSQVEGLGVHHGLAAIDSQCSAHEDQDAIVCRRLTVHSGDGVCHIGQAGQLVEDVLLALELLTLEGQHGLV